MKMRETEIDNKCGTPMCHGGWYAVATQPKLEHYTEGADLMANDLGFNNGKELEQWARENRELWGGNGGMYMFCNLNAFTIDGEVNPNLTLKDIRNWWAGVHNRTCPDSEPVAEV